jgi:hypothetical protein
MWRRNHSGLIVTHNNIPWLMEKTYIRAASVGTAANYFRIFFSMNEHVFRECGFRMNRQWLLTSDAYTERSAHGD